MCLIFKIIIVILFLITKKLIKLSKDINIQFNKFYNFFRKQRVTNLSKFFIVFSIISKAMLLTKSEK